MARGTSVNYSATGTAFTYATATSDAFVSSDVQLLAQAVESHDHTSTKGLGVGRVQTATVPASPAAGVPNVRVNGDLWQWWAATAAALKTGVDLDSTQSMTNKTLTSPAIASAALSGTHTGNTTFSGQVTFSNVTAPVIAATVGPSSTQQHTLPVVTSDTVVLLAATQTLTGKTLSAPTLSGSIAGTPTWASTQSMNTTGFAATLQTPRAINGVNFDGSAAITVTAAAGTLSGATLAAGVTASSLTSFGASPTISSPTISSPTMTGTWGGVPAWSSTQAMNISGSSAACTGNAATATALQTARAINGVNFDGTAAITVAAAAGTLTGATLAAGVTASSLTSHGTLTSLTVSGATDLSGGVALITQQANGSDSWKLKRNTDTSPTGHFLRAVNNADNATVFSVDVDGSWNGPGTPALAGDVRLSNDSLINFRNAANLGDVVFVRVDSSNAIRIGGSGTDGHTAASVTIMNDSAGVGHEFGQTYAHFYGCGTTGNAANANLTADANQSLLRSTSSLRYKNVVGTLPLADARSLVMGLEPITYTSKSVDDVAGQIFVGFGAEQVTALDDRFATFDGDGDPDWVQYPILVVPLAVVAQDHEARIAALEAKLAALEARAA